MRVVFREDIPMGYNSTGEIVVSDDVDKCDLCGQPGPTLSMDGSQGEYGSPEICFPCCIRVFGEFAERRSKGAED